MKNNSKHITLLFFGVISIAVAGFGYWYMHAAVISQAENYSQALKDTEIYNENKKNEQNLQKIYTQTIDDRAKLTSYIVTEDKIVDFIESIENIGQTTNTKVTLTSINSEEMKDLEKGAFGHIKARVDVTGSWSGVMSAISALENLPFSISLNNNRLSTASGAGKGGSWSLSADVKVLSIK